MTELDFFGGVDEIGGNKIRVKGNGNSIFLDFGMSFSRANQFFSEFLQPRKANGILDFVEFGLLPCIKGIYREDYLRHCGLSSSKEPALDGVLLSHAHMDHSAYIHHLREDIPIYMTDGSYLILKTLEETSASSFNELLTLKKTFHLRRKKRPPKSGSEYTKFKGEEAQVKRKIEILKPYQEFSIGDWAVKSTPVDHSLPGACAYLVDTCEKALVYTGDLRFHGRNPELTGKFIKKARKFQPTVMLSEGTRISGDTNTTEESIQKRASEIINDFKGHVIVNYPIRDLDRFLTFYQVSKMTDRTFAVSLKQAYMLQLFNAAGYTHIDDIAIYVPRKDWGMMGDGHFVCVEDDWLNSSQIHPYHTETDYGKWEREFLCKDNLVSYQDIRDNPSQYIFGCDFFELKELIDIKPENGLYIWSKTEPFNEEMEIDFKRVANWIKHFKLNCKVEGMHGSGHANGVEILNMIREIEPEIVYPIHTEEKERFQVLEEDGIKVVYPDKA
jgi:ribonuclease J